MSSLLDESLPVSLFSVAVGSNLDASLANLIRQEEEEEGRRKRDVKHICKLNCLTVVSRPPVAGEKTYESDRIGN